MKVVDVKRVYGPDYDRLRSAVADILAADGEIISIMSVPGGNPNHLSEWGFAIIFSYEEFEGEPT